MSNNFTDYDRQRFEYIMDGAGLGSWDWWLATNQVSFDKRWCEMLGLDPNNTPQKLETWDLRVHPDDKAIAYQKIQEHLRGESEVYECVHRLRHENGSWVWILDRGRVSEKNSKGEAIRFTGTHLDITAFKEAEILSAEIQNIAKIGGWELDTATFKTKWTEQTYHIHAVPVGTPTDKIMGILFYAEHERHRISEYVQKCMQGISYKDIFEFIDAAGKSKWVEVSGIPIFGADGKIPKLRGTFQDVSEKIELQNKLEQQKIKTLQTSKLASLGEISAGVAHEINNPLGIISGHADLVLQFIDQQDRIKKYIHNIKYATERIVKIVNGLKKFSRTAEQNQKKICSLNSVVQDALLLTSLKSNRYGISIKINMSDEHFIMANEIEISQVLVNLLNNSIDAVKEAQQKWVAIDLFAQADSIVLKIEDSGSGIPEKIADKIFQPFFTTKPVGQGTGLGLSISKGILDDHQATIELMQDLPNTCFKINFLKVEKNIAAA